MHVIFSIKEFLGIESPHCYTYKGDSSRHVARLIFADFPTSLVVHSFPTSSRGVHCLAF